MSDDTGITTVDLLSVPFEKIFFPFWHRKQQFPWLNLRVFGNYLGATSLPIAFPEQQLNQEKLFFSPSLTSREKNSAATYLVSPPLAWPGLRQVRKKGPFSRKKILMGRKRLKSFSLSGAFSRERGRKGQNIQSSDFLPLSLSLSLIST